MKISIGDTIYLEYENGQVNIMVNQMTPLCDYLDWVDCGSLSKEELQNLADAIGDLVKEIENG